jgi:hypothetical protein
MIEEVAAQLQTSAELGIVEGRRNGTPTLHTVDEIFDTMKGMLNTS